MGKLTLQNTAGFNAGNNYVVRFMRVSDIVIDPEISKIFCVQETIRYKVVNDIKESGFDKSQPLTIWKGTGFLLDGHTRLSAAIEAGLEEVPVVEKEFDSRDAAIWYTIVRQALRRSLTPAEILKAVEMLPNERNRKGEGSLAGQLAEMLGLNASTVYDAKKILREATPDVLEKVKNGKMSFKSGSRNPTGKATEEIDHNAAVETIETDETTVKTPSENTKSTIVDFSVTDSYGLPENVKFLKSAVILLVEAKQHPAARFLIKHYLRKNEISGFYKLLPDSTRESLEDVLSLCKSISDNVLTAHAKIGSAYGFIENNMTEKALDLLKDAMKCLDSFESELARLD